MAERGADPEPVVGAAWLTQDRLICGWAWRPSTPDTRLAVEVWRDGECLAQATADVAGEGADAVAAGDGRHGFLIDVAGLIAPGAQVLEVRTRGGAVLSGGRIKVKGGAHDGEVPSPGYLDDEEARLFLESTPFEHYAYEATRMFPRRLASRLLNRLRRERNAYLDGPPGQGVKLLVLGALEGSAAASSWSRQSYPWTSIDSAPGDPRDLRRLVEDAHRVVIAAPDDVIHPSTAGLVTMSGGEGMVWHRYAASESLAGAGGVLYQRPPFDPATARHGAASDTTLSLPGAVIAQAPRDVLAALAKGRVHPLHVWLADRPLRWVLHPEALTVGEPRTPSRAEALADQALCGALAAAKGFDLSPTATDHGWPYVLTPRRRASSVSVLIAYRDRAERTVRCLESIAAQRTSGVVEVVLVDNQSRRDEAAKVSAAALALFPGRCRLLSYDHPFNHSAQNNLAAEAATGEVIVICNNDVALQTPDALEQLSAFALAPGVGAVGCRLDDPGGGRGSYGHVVLPLTDDPFRAPIGEQDDATFADFVHAAPGVTFALAAIARDRFLRLGGLDAEKFPIGYNDADFNFRAARAGLTAIYLGHVRAWHPRGASRTGDNESVQALRLNQAYAFEIGQRRRQLLRSVIDLPRRG